MLPMSAMPPPIFFQYHLAMHHHWIDIPHSFPSVLVDPGSSAYIIPMNLCEEIPGKAFYVLY